MKFYTAGFAAALLLGFASSGNAQDAFGAPGAYDWSGFYLGVHGGYGAGTDDVDTTMMMNGAPVAATATNSFSLGGGVGGVQAGFNVQLDQVVLGLEADYSASGIAGQFQFDPTRDEAIAGGSLDYLASLRGRIGIALDRTLLYATGGVAVTHNQGFANNVYEAAPTVDVATGSGQLMGFVAGAGVEHALTENISLRGEYLYYDFGRGNFDMTSTQFPVGGALNTQPDINIGVLRVGINYGF